MKRGLSIAAGSTTLMLLACIGGSTVPNLPAVVDKSLELSVDAPNVLNVVQVITAGEFGVLRRVEVVRVVPIVTPDMTVLAARASFTTRRAGFAAREVPGFFCTEWPPKGFGPTHPVTGLRLEAGDLVAFTFFLQAGQPGTYVLNGMELHVREAEGSDVAVYRSERVTVAMPRKASVDELPANQQRVCSPATYQGVRWLNP